MWNIKVEFEVSFSGGETPKETYELFENEIITIIDKTNNIPIKDDMITINNSNKRKKITNRDFNVDEETIIFLLGI